MKTLTTDNLNNFLRLYPTGLSYISFPFNLASEVYSNLQDGQSLDAGQVKIIRHEEYVVLRSDNVGALKYVFDQKFKSLLGNNLAYYYQLPLPEIQVWSIDKYDQLKTETMPKAGEIEVFVDKLSALFNLNPEFALCQNILAGYYLQQQPSGKNSEKNQNEKFWTKRPQVEDLEQTNIEPELITSRAWTDSPVQIVPTSSLKYFPGNSRFYADTQNTADLESSIEVYGIIEPLIINEQKFILAGNRRCHAALQNKLLTVPVRIVTGVENELNFVIHANVTRKKTYLTRAKEAIMFKKFAAQLKKTYGVFELRKRYPYGKVETIKKDGKIAKTVMGWSTERFVCALVNMRKTNLKKLLEIYRKDPGMLDLMDDNEWSLDKGYSEMKVEKKSTPTYEKKKVLCNYGYEHTIKVPIEDDSSTGKINPETPKIKKINTNSESSAQYSAEEYFNTAQNKTINSDVDSRLSGDNKPEQQHVENNQAEDDVKREPEISQDEEKNKS